MERYLGPVSGQDAGDAGEVVGHIDPGPCRCVEQRLYRGQTVVAEFEDENSPRQEIFCRLRDEIGAEFVACLAAVKRDFRFVLADFAHERCGFAAADVGRIADNYIEAKRRVSTRGMRNAKGLRIPLAE